MLWHRQVNPLNRIIASSFTSGGLLAPSTAAESLDDLLLECLDEVLVDLLGRRSREAIYDCLERDQSLARTDIPEHMTLFIQLLEETFGKGSRTIWKAVVKRMYEKLEWKFYDNPGYEFIDYMEEIRGKVTRALIEHARSLSTKP
jgi:hypothetical protein